MTRIVDSAGGVWERPHVIRFSLRSLVVAAASLVALSCGSLGRPTEPSPAPDRPVTIQEGLVLGVPAPDPTPTPSPEPSASPDPGASGCDAPLPPEVASVDVKVHLRGSPAWTLDSTPLVHDAAYCALIGFTDGRGDCPVRPEGHPQRQACELYATGRAKDTNRAGPTWYLNGSFCTGSASGCENHPDNQYQALAYRGGTYQACAKNGVCGDVVVDR